LPFRSVRFLRDAVSSGTLDANSTLGVRQRFPSIDITSGVHSRTSRRSSLGALPAKPRTRSALVVPPDSDGLLLLRLRRSVAPCSRSWGSLCFNPRVYDSRSYATVAGSPLQRVPFEAFPSQIAVTRLRITIPSRRCPRSTFRGHLSAARPSLRAPDLRALLHLRSRCERSTVASRVLPVASLGFSFQSVSCPTRHSSELRAHNGRQADRWGTSRSPRANPGPAATVADGADRLCRAEPASRTPRRASLTETADTSFRKCHPLCSCWRRRMKRTPCVPSVRHPKTPAAPTLR